MNDYILYIIIAVILLVVCLYFLLIPRNKEKESPIDIQGFIEALGGADNIKSVRPDKSRVKVTLFDVSRVNEAKLKSLGATGVVMANHKVTLISGKASEDIAEYTKKEL